MISFFAAIIVLIVGYLIYGKFVERVFWIDDSLKTPAIEMQDGVDFVPMNWKKIFLIQFLNIAGFGPIFGAIQAAPNIGYILPITLSTGSTVANI